MLLGSGMCAALMLVMAGTPDHWLLPLGATGGGPWLGYWAAVATWTAGAIIGARRGIGRLVLATGAVIASTLIPSALLLGACATGDCL